MNRIRNVAAALGLSATLGAAPLVIAGPTTVYAPPTPAEARNLQNSGQFEAAATAWQEIAAAEPDNGLAWFNLGYCLHAAGYMEQAIGIHQKAATFDDYEGIALYNLACAYSLVGDADAAFEAMQESIAAGFDTADRADGDSDFDNVRDDPRYAMLIHGSSSASTETDLYVQEARSRQAQPQGGAGDMQQLAEFVGTRVQGIIEDMSPQIQGHVQELVGHAMMVGQQLMQEFQSRVEQDDQLMGAIMQIHEAVESNPQLMMLIEQAHQWIESKMGGMGMGMGGAAPQAAPREPAAVREAPAAGVAEAAVAAGAPAITMAQANQLQNSGDHAAAAAAFAQLLKVNPENGPAAFGYAYNIHMAGEIDAAIAAHAAAAKFDQYHGIAMYNLGCAYALEGNAERSIRALRSSIEAGFDVATRIGSDTDFDGIRDNAAFKAFVAEIGG